MFQCHANPFRSRPIGWRHLSISHVPIFVNGPPRSPFELISFWFWPLYFDTKNGITWHWNQFNWSSKKLFNMKMYFRRTCHCKEYNLQHKFKQTLWGTLRNHETYFTWPPRNQVKINPFENVPRRQFIWFVVNTLYIFWLWSHGFVQ